MQFYYIMEYSTINPTVYYNICSGIGNTILRGGKAIWCLFVYIAYLSIYVSSTYLSTMYLAYKYMIKNLFSEEGNCKHKIQNNGWAFPSDEPGEWASLQKVLVLIPISEEGRSQVFSLHIRYNLHASKYIKTKITNAY